MKRIIFVRFDNFNPPFLKGVFAAFTVLFFTFTSASYGFSQEVPIRTVGVMPFEVYGEYVTTADATQATSMVVSTLGTSVTLAVLTGAQAGTAEFLVQGQISGGGSGPVILTARLTEAGSGRLINTARSQAATLGAISIFDFCVQIADFIPFTNFLLGRWESTLQMVDGPVSAILDFRPGGVVIIEKYETWEHNGSHSLRFHAIGTGTYSFFGHHLPRTFSAAGRTVNTNASMNITLTLEDALPEFTQISANGLLLLFDSDRRNFELLNAGLPFGINLTGASVYPSARIFYRNFTRL